MPLGTLDRTRRRFFKQGPRRSVQADGAQRARAVPDGGRCALSHRRSRCAAAVAAVLYPIQWLAMRPVLAVQRRQPTISRSCRARSAARPRRAGQLALQAEQAGQVEQLAQENARLRKLLELRAEHADARPAAEVLYDAADPYTRKVDHRQGPGQRHRSRLAGDRRVGRAGPGDARAPAHQRGHAGDRPRPGDARAERAHRRAQRGLRRRHGARRRHGTALHGRQRRRAGRRPADHQRRRRRLPARPAGGQGRQGSSAAPIRPLPASTACRWRWWTARAT